MTKANQASLTPKQALQEWAKKNEITPPALARATHYGYQHCWNLLAGGTDPNFETLGRLVVAYDYESIKPIVKSFVAPESAAA